MSDTNNTPTIKIQCPKCKAENIVNIPQEPAKLVLVCRNEQCKQKFVLPVTEKLINAAYKKNEKKDTQQQEQQASIPPTDPTFNTSFGTSNKMACIIKKKRKFWQKDQSFALHVGDNIIGRETADSTADIAISDDSTVSRQSLKITVEKSGSIYKYVLTVVNAKNPVYVNDVVWEVGTSQYVDAGTSIVLGQTKLMLTV